MIPVDRLVEPKYKGTLVWSINYTTIMATQSTSPQVIKKLEKEIAKEGKTEESHIKHVMKELSSTEKAQAKAHKVY